MHKSFDILVPGEINADLILSGDVQPEFGQAEKLVDAAELQIGSSSAIFACGASRLGLRVAFTGLCAADLFGCYMLDEMKKRGIDVSNVIVRGQGETGLSVILNRGYDRAILTHLGLIPDFLVSDIPKDLLVGVRHLHVASYFLQTGLQPGLPKLFRAARSLGATTSLDTNYDPSGRWSGLYQLLPLTDVFLPNAGEALALTGAPDVQSAARQLAQSAGLVAVKLGPDGALACRSGESWHAASPRVRVVDTVGAGDSFDAGFLYGYLSGWEPERCLKLACACGALSTRAAGGTQAQPDLEEALKYDP